MPKIFGDIKNDYKQVPLGVKLIIFVIFLRTMGWGFADPFFSIYLYQFKNDYTVIGLFSGLLSLSALISIIPLLRLGDKMKEKIIISDGQLLYLFVIAGYVISGIFKNIPLLILTLLFNGIAQTFVVVGTEMYIEKYGAPGKARPFALYIAMDYLGWTLGMLIAAFTVRYYGLNYMFLFILPSIVSSFFILPRVSEKGIRSLFAGFRHYFHSSKDVLRVIRDFKDLNSKMLFFLVIAFFDGVVYMFSYIFIPLLGLSVNMSLSSVAILMAVMYFPFVLSFFFTEAFEKSSKMDIISIGLFIGAVSFTLLYFIVDKYGILILAATISLSMAIVRPLYSGAITRLSRPSMVGEMTGINSLVQRIGRVLGPVLTGVVADHYGLPTSFLMIAVIAFGLGSIALILRGYDYFISPNYLPNPQTQN